MVQIISVEPVGSGWVVHQKGVAPPQEFPSGAQAEKAARRLGARLSRDGAPAEIQIWLRDGALAGRVVC